MKMLIKKSSSTSPSTTQVVVVLLFIIAFLTTNLATSVAVAVALTVENENDVAYCVEEAMHYYFEEYLLDPFWFVPEVFTTEQEILEKCFVSIDSDDPTKEKLSIECDWSKNEKDVFRGKGVAYEYVQESCDENGGIMYLVHSMKTINEYSSLSDTTTIDVIETSVHYNVPICLAPTCNPEKFLREVIPCSQFDLFPFDEEWIYEAPENNVCTTDLIVAATNMDKKCESDLTYFIPTDDDFETSCVYIETRNLWLCDYSKYTEEDKNLYDPDNRCNDANLYKHTYSIFGNYDEEYYKETDGRDYYLNVPTCLKEGCDVETYFYKNLIPYYAYLWEVDVPLGKIISVSGIGILPFDWEVENEEEEEEEKDSEKGSKGSKKSKKAKKSKKSKKLKGKNRYEYDE